MIIAARIQGLSPDLRAATLRAAAEQRDGSARWTVISDVERLEHNLVDCLERLGYDVKLKRRAA
jgi:hypothetical protein